MIVAVIRSLACIGLIICGGIIATHINPLVPETGHCLVVGHCAGVVRGVRDTCIAKNTDYLSSLVGIEFLRAPIGVMGVRCQRRGS